MGPLLTWLACLNKPLLTCHCNWDHRRDDMAAPSTRGREPLQRTQLLERLKDVVHALCAIRIGFQAGAKIVAACRPIQPCSTRRHVPNEAVL